jgi:hypothetical protein
MNMATYQNFKRAAVPQQVAQKLQTITMPAPTRGLVLNENESFMQPGAAIVLDNWRPTMKGLAIRGGCKTWAILPETVPVVSMFNYISGNTQRMFAGTATKLYDVTSSYPTSGPAPNWQNAHFYEIGDRATDTADGTIWISNNQQITGAAPLTFAQYRAAVPGTWSLVVTPPIIKSGQLSGNYVASQLANQSGDHMLVANEAGDYLLHFDGTAWLTFNASQINADPAITPPPSCIAGHNLTYVWKYRGRFFFIEGGTMNAWYLPTNAYQGRILQIPLAGAATKGGKLLCGFTWSIDAGDGIDDKCVFMTDQGELLIFTGSDPSTAANWRQEGRYATSTPLGMNCHQAIGGDVLIATVDGIIPISASITKDTSQLELASITRAIKPMWRQEVNAKRALPWTMMKWDEYGALFVSWPGGIPGSYTLGLVNIATGAWARYTGWDAMCFGRLRADAFFGTQDGKIVQMDRTGTDNGVPYTCIMVGGWEMFSSQSATVVWRQARASFAARAGEPFQPQLSATTDYVVVIPPPPSAAPDPGLLDVWDQGLWGPTPGFTPPWTPSNPYPAQAAPTAAEKDAYLQWDQPVPAKATVRSTMWVSIGYTGYSHAPIVQVTIAQKAVPDIELISIAATYDTAGVNV